ncbi:MAG: DUF309 domain-containing protein [Chloroflexota bacterium]|nr:DUF309 domain-containing protein [Chloroflexota bacterium]
MAQGSLPLLPSRNRRQLDVLWLERLRADGWRAYLAEPSAPPAAFLRAVQEFNEGKFWHCHETLEGLWRPTPYPRRLFYQGVIKVAVSFHHLGEHNRIGARSLLSGSLACLAPFLPEFMGVRTEALVREAEAWLVHLAVHEEPPWEVMDRLPRPKIALPGE